MKKNRGVSKKDFPKGTIRSDGHWFVPGAPELYSTKFEVLAWLAAIKRHTPEPMLPKAEPIEAVLTIEDEENLKSIESAFNSATVEVATVVDGEPQAEMLDVFEKLSENGVNIDAVVKTIKTRKSGKSTFVDQNINYKNAYPLE